MKQISSALAIVCLLAISCNLKPHLALSDHSPYTLQITDFPWSYGTIEVNKFHGDFETLDRKVFDVLVNKQGSCAVIIIGDAHDKYGKPITSRDTIGVINLFELNRYESWEYWHKDGGIQKLLHAHLFPPMPLADSAALHTDTTSRSRQIDTERAGKTYSFTADQLYPTVDDKNYIDSLSHIDSGLFTVDGIITAVYPGNNTIKVHETQGIQFDHLIYVYPHHASTAVCNDLIAALKKGSKIHSICTARSGLMEQLISADITIKPQ